MVWLKVVSAFLGGLTVAFLLEAYWLRRRRHEAALAYVGLAGMALLAALVSWQLWPKSVVGPVAPLVAVAPLPDVLPPPRIDSLLLPTAVATAQSTPLLTVPATATLPPRLTIPALGVSVEVVMIPIREGMWDVTTLGSGVGWLTTTGAHPGDEWAMALAGHMTFPTEKRLDQGAFANLQYVTVGSDIYYELGDKRYHYQVDTVGRIAPEAVDALYVPDGSKLLLVTCTDWDENGRIYANRLLVEATAVGDGF